MSLLDTIKPKPKEDLYLEFKAMFDTLELERKRRERRRKTFVVMYAWYEDEWKEMK